MKGKFYGVSVGPGDPEYMTLKAVRVIGTCPVLALPRTDGKNCVALDIARAAVDISGKEILPLDFLMVRDAKQVRERHRQLTAMVCQRLAAGQDVAMLNLGDASLYASHSYIRRRVAAAGYQTETVAGVTSFCACAALLGVSLTRPRQPLHIIPGDYPGLEQELSTPGTKVIMKSGKGLERVKAALKDCGAGARARMVSNCGLPGQTVYHDISEAEGGYFSTILVDGEREEGEQP